MKTPTITKTKTKHRLYSRFWFTKQKQILTLWLYVVFVASLLLLFYSDLVDNDDIYLYIYIPIFISVLSFYSFDQLRNPESIRCRYVSFILFYCIFFIFFCFVLCLKELRYETHKLITWEFFFLLNGNEENELYAIWFIFATLFLVRSLINLHSTIWNVGGVVIVVAVHELIPMFMWASLHLSFVCHHHHFHSVLTINCSVCAPFALRCLLLIL